MSREQWPDSAVSQSTILLLRAILECILLRLGCQIILKKPILGQYSVKRYARASTVPEGYLTHTVPYWLGGALKYSLAGWDRHSESL